jgi:hypothetical protein
LKDLSVLAISAATAVIVGFIANANGTQGAIVGMFFFIASIYFWGRLFAGTPLKMLWLLLVTMAIAGLPVVLKSDVAVFTCVLLTMLLITLDGFVLAKAEETAPPRSKYARFSTAWDPDLAERDQKLIEDYERSKGALIFDDEDSKK